MPDERLSSLNPPNSSLASHPTVNWIEAGRASMWIKEFHSAARRKSSPSPQDKPRPSPVDRDELAAGIAALQPTCLPRASFASYAVEKKISRTPERFGRGAIEGVAGDGGFNMMLSEIETARHLGLTFAVIVVNNAASGYVHPEVKG